MSKVTLYEVKGQKTLLEMSWLEVKAYLKINDVAIIPISSTEQHSTHLLLGSDMFQAEK